MVVIRIVEHTGNSAAAVLLTSRMNEGTQGVIEGTTCPRHELLLASVMRSQNSNGDCHIVGDCYVSDSSYQLVSLSFFFIYICFFSSDCGEAEHVLVGWLITQANQVSVESSQCYAIQLF